MMHFKKGFCWKACHDEERNLYTAETWWRGDYDLYEIDAEVYNQIGEPGVSDDDATRLIHSGRHLYSSEDSPIGPPTDMVIDENYATLCPWARIQKSGNQMPQELTDVAVKLFENETTREHRSKKRSTKKKE